MGRATEVEVLRWRERRLSQPELGSRIASWGMRARRLARSSVGEWREVVPNLIELDARARG